MNTRGESYLFSLKRCLVDGLDGNRFDSQSMVLEVLIELCGYVVCENLAAAVDFFHRHAGNLSLYSGPHLVCCKCPDGLDE
jgi:hypothetical protein